MILLPPRPTHPYTLVPYPTLFRYPVLAAHKHAGIAVLQFQVVDTLEDLRKGFPALEVQVTVVGGLGQALAAVVDADQVSVGLGRGPACAYRQGRVELALDFTDVETDAECWPGERRGETDRQRQFCPAPERVC